MKGYEYFDHTADVGIYAYGKTIEELFVNAALALSDQMVNIAHLSSSMVKTLSLSATSEEKLLYDFLEEIVYLKDSENILFSDFKLKIKKEKGHVSLIATLKGDPINPKKQELRNDVKAITMHLFTIEKINEGYKATVIIDI